MKERFQSRLYNLQLHSNFFKFKSVKRTRITTSFPGSLFFSSPGARERERDPGLVWSRASVTIENAREGTGRKSTLGTRLPG